MPAAPAEAPREAQAPEKVKKAPAEAAAEKTVAKEQKSTADAVAAQVPDMRTPRGPIMELKSLPKLPSLGTVTKGGVAALTVASPATLAVTVPALGVMKLWGKAKQYRPFSWIDRGARAVGGAASEGARSLWNVGTYPFRLGGTLARNTLAVGVNTVGGAARIGIDFLHDLLVHSDGETKNVLEKFVDMVTSAPGKLYHLGEYIVKKGADTISYGLNHPIRTTIGLGFLITFLTNTPGFLATGGQFVDAGLKILQGIGGLLGKLGGAAPAVAPI